MHSNNLQLLTIDTNVFVLFVIYVSARFSIGPVSKFYI